MTGEIEILHNTAKKYINLQTLMGLFVTRNTLFETIESLKMSSAKLLIAVQFCSVHLLLILAGCLAYYYLQGGPIWMVLLVPLYMQIATRTSTTSRSVQAVIADSRIHKIQPQVIFTWLELPCAIWYIIATMTTTQSGRGLFLTTKLSVCLHLRDKLLCFVFSVFKHSQVSKCSPNCYIWEKSLGV